MQIVDLSHTISSGMTVYPGTEPPKIDTACTIEGDGFLEKRITFYSHTGTHMDAPAHVIPGARQLDQFPVEHFIGRAIVIDVTGIETPTIDIPALEAHARRIKGVSFVLLRSGWSRFWNSKEYFSALW